MSPLTVRCIRAAFAYLLLGIGLGAAFALDRSLGATLRALHVESNLWGWGTLLIYGMAYHMLPRFTGRMLRFPRLAEAQSYGAIFGVALVILGWGALVAGEPWAYIPLLAGGTLELCAALVFVVLAADLLRPPRTD